MNKKYNFQETKSKIEAGVTDLVKGFGVILAHYGSTERDVATAGAGFLTPELNGTMLNAYSSSKQMIDKHRDTPSVNHADLAANLDKLHNFTKNFEAVTEAGKAMKEFALEQTGVNHLDVVKDYSKSLGREVETSNALSHSKKFEHVLEGKTINNGVPNVGSDKNKGPELNIQ